MKNVVGVLLTVSGLFGVVWAVSGSVRWSIGVASVALLCASVLLLIDVEEPT